ncbi:MAG TPA: HNH endonuclease [Firmicutes bacterium]|nr:HNH endonuclease [Candidatus Fermentithermobacillaceae bacterium]
MATKSDIEKAWDKAQVIRGLNPNVWRRDPYGNKIRKGSYGTHGEYGWEVDHKKPISEGGSDSPRNLQAVHWKENRRKGSQYPYRRK